MKLRMLAVLVLAALAATAAAAETLLVLNKEGTLAIVDTATSKVLGTVRTGDSPHEVAASTDGKLAFVSNYGGGAAPGTTLSVIDIAARKEIHRVDISPLQRPHGLSAAGDKVYFTAEVNKVVGRYDPASNRVDFLLGTGQGKTHMVIAAPDGKLYTANIEGDSISIFEPAGVGNWNQTVIPVGKAPEGMDISPDGKQLWAAHGGDGGLSIIDLASKRVINTIRVQTQRSNRLKFTPDGRLVLISDLGAGELLILERETKKELKRMKLGRGTAGILVTPDSSLAYVAVTGDNDVAVVDLKTFDLKERIKTGTGPDGMAWAR